MQNPSRYLEDGDKENTINIACEEDRECNSRITRVIILNRNLLNNFLFYFYILSNFIKPLASIVYHSQKCPIRWTVML